MVPQGRRARSGCAQDHLGYLYERGVGVPQNYSEAVAWYRKTAEQGYAIAENNLGTMYASGRGVPLDYEQAAVWYRKAGTRYQRYLHLNWVAI